MSLVKDVVYHCRTQLKMEKFKYTWTIDKFWHVLEHITDLYSNEVTEHLRFYMHVNDALRFYAVTNNGASVKASYSIFLKTNSGEKLLVSKTGILCQKNNFELLYKVDISELESERKMYIVNNTFTICFDFNMYHSLFNNSICYPCEPEELIASKGKSLIVNEQSDEVIIFTINEKYFMSANKNLLCSQSGVFKDMFYDKKDVRQEIEINNILERDTLEELLFFLETGYLSKKVKTNVAKLCDVLVAANEYEIKSLKLICEQRLIRNVSVTNVVHILKIAELHNGVILKNYAEDFIKLFYKDIANTIEFETLIEQFPNLLTEIKNIQIPTKTVTFV